MRRRRRRMRRRRRGRRRRIRRRRRRRRKACNKIKTCHTRFFYQYKHRGKVFTKNTAIFLGVALL